MQAGVLYPLVTTDGVHFTGALAQNASLQEDLDLPAAVGAGGSGRCRIRSAIFWSSQNLDWEFQVYSKYNATSADPNQDSFCGRWAWIAGDGSQIGGAGLWRYYIDGLDILYQDEDFEGSGLPPNPPGMAKIHLLLVNRNATAKFAYGFGNVRLRLNLEPVFGG